MAKKSFLESSSNPMFGEEVYKDVIDQHEVVREGTMTINGAITKTFALMGLMLVGAAIGWTFPSKFLMWTGILGGAAIYFITSRNKDKAPYLAPLYAVVEGLLVGVVSFMYASVFDGIILQAASLTFAIMFSMLLIFRLGLVKVTDKFRAGVSMAVGGVMIFYAINIVLYMFGITVSFLHDGGLIAIGISAVIIVIASMNLLLDFDNFVKGEQYNAPKYMEWYSGMGLLFTLVWLYLELLRLISYFAGSD